MGLLADSKSRRKICKDPNNTKWSRDTSTFGQKMLRAQGWEPGQYLGSKDARHADLHTAANASYIRVTLKDDVKGLGFNKAKEDEVTGLDVFSDLLSRLNGKSEDDIDGDRRARLDFKTNVYVEQKWGPMRFVKGGLLVGDSLKTEESVEQPAATPDADGQCGATKATQAERKTKKRKLAADEETNAESDADADADADTDAKKRRKRRKEERRARKAGAEASAGATESDAKANKSKKSKKNRSLHTDNVDAPEDQPDSADAGSGKKPSRSKRKDKPLEALADDAVTEKKRSKREKKEKRKREKADAEQAELSAPEATATGTSTPSGSGLGTMTPAGGSRNFARSRFIAAKRQAMMDTKSLNQIFMIKT